MYFATIKKIINLKIIKMSKIIKTQNKSEKVANLISDIIGVFFIGGFAISIIYFFYNFILTIIEGGSFNL